MTARRWESGLLLVALALAPSVVVGADSPPGLPDEVFEQPPEGDVVDFVLFGNGRAAVVRVHLRVGGRSFRTSWADYALRLHAYLDWNDDHVLTTSEATTGLGTNRLANPLTGIPVMPTSIRSWVIDSNPADGKVSFKELVTYLKTVQTFEPLSPQIGPPADPRVQALFDHLDRDHDVVLSPAELAETDGLLVTLDRDEDETVSLDELTPNRSLFADQFQVRVNIGRNSAFDTTKSAVIPLTTADLRASAVRRLLDSLGKKTLAIAPEPLGAEPGAFRAADRSGDGLLDRAELLRYLDAPTIHLEVAVTLKPDRSGPGKIERMACQDSSSRTDVLVTHAGANGALVVEFAGAEFELRTADVLNPTMGTLQTRFQRVDTNKDGVIDAEEARGDVFIQRILTAADRNGNAKLTELELKGYVDLTNAAEEAMVSLIVSDQGTALSERLDADHDGRFTVRELRAARSRLSAFDADHDGRIALMELPRRIQVGFGRGPMQNRPRALVVAGLPGAPNPGTPARPDLPAWFTGMDRNRDGDVSAREFLGTSDQFRRFDADNDGLIDGDEAKRVR